MFDSRIIKKYPNRRLYDMTESRYVTLDEIKNLVLGHTKIQIIDTRSEEDVTNYVLLQIINEQESSATPIFTTEILQNIIRFYNNPLQEVMSQFLEKSLSLFIQQQKNIQHDLQNFISQTLEPFNMFEQATKNKPPKKKASSKIPKTKPRTIKRPAKKTSSKVKKK